MVRFLHSGDWQLGMTRSVLGEAAQARFDDARFEAIRRMAELARRERCDFALVCGDVFESNLVEPATWLRALDALGDFDCPVYLLPGNHDPLDAASLYRSRPFREATPGGVHLLDDDRPRQVAPGVELVGAPWPSRRPETNPVGRALDALGPAGPLRVLAAHGVVDALVPERRDASQIPLAPLEAALGEERLHYVALGDRHSLTRLAEDRVCYAGAPVATDWSEREPGQVLLVELERDRVQLNARAVGDWHFLSVEAPGLDGAEDVAALAEQLETLPAKERSVLRLTLEGGLDLRAAAHLETLLERVRHLFAGLDLRDTGLRVAADATDLDALDLCGFAERAVARLREEGRGEGEEARSARDALALLVRVAEGAAP